VPDTELAALYRGARCVLYPSLYEGFGLPVLEAMACGVPVVTSRGTAMEEVAGEAAVLVDPLDVSAIAEGIATSAARRDELVRVGLERARAFDWKQSADDVVELWRELA
jgi:glycosyltransferase involved in cell wall biosynthesis